MEIGFGPSQVLRPGSGTARPGHAGGGCCAEQRILPPNTTPQSFLFKANPAKNHKQLNSKIKPPTKYIYKKVQIKRLNSTSSQATITKTLKPINLPKKITKNLFKCDAYQRLTSPTFPIITEIHKFGTIIIIFFFKTKK